MEPLATGTPGPLGVGDGLGAGFGGFPGFGFLPFLGGGAPAGGPVGTGLGFLRVGVFVALCLAGAGREFLRDERTFFVAMGESSEI